MEDRKLESFTIHEFTVTCVDAFCAFQSPYISGYLRMGDLSLEEVEIALFTISTDEAISSVSRRDEIASLAALTRNDI